MGNGPVPGRRKDRCWDWRSSEQTVGRFIGLDRHAFVVLEAVKCCGVVCEILVLWVDETLTLERTWEMEKPS